MQHGEKKRKPPADNNHGVGILDSSHRLVTTPGAIIGTKSQVGDVMASLQHVSNKRGRNLNHQSLVS